MRKRLGAAVIRRKREMRKYREKSKEPGFAAQPSLANIKKKHTTVEKRSYVET
jgi:hypothetical protein